MGTGVGEAMLIGAAVGATAGGAGAAIQGGDPLKGALTGGAMGAVGGGLGAGFGAGAGAGAGSGAGAGAGSGAAASTTSLVPGAMAGAEGATLGSTIGTASNVGTGISGVSAGSGSLGSAGFGGYGAVNTGTSGLYAGAAPGAASGTSAGIPSSLAVSQGSALPAGYGAGAGAGSTAPVTNVFGQAAGTPGYLSNTQLGMTAGTTGLAGAMQAERGMLGVPPNEDYDGPLSKLKYDPDRFTASAPQYAPASVYRPTYAAEGGIMKLADGGMTPAGNYGYPMNKNPDTVPNLEARYGMAEGGIARYAPGGIALTGGLGGIPSGGGYQTTPDSLTPRGLESLMGNKKKRLTQEELDSSMLQGLTPAAYESVYGEGIRAEQRMASPNLAKGGIADLGSYSDGGRMLKGPGDGMSDNIPGIIGGKQPARLADGEFVIPADVVSHLGNGSTDAGAKQLYSMMDRVRKARTGKKAQGKQIKPAKYMVA
jgi:hypothetical protein